MVLFPFNVAIRYGKNIQLGCKEKTETQNIILAFILFCRFFQLRIYTLLLSINFEVKKNLSFNILNAEERWGMRTKNEKGYSIHFVILLSINYL